MGGAYRWDDGAARWIPLDWISQDDANLNRRRCGRRPISP